MKLRLLVIISLMLTSTAIVKSPDRSANHGRDVDLGAVLPVAFADWEAVPNVQMILPAEYTNIEIGAVHYTAYQDRYGRIIAVVLAHGDAGDDTLRLHLPENCYTAQGFTIEDKSVHAVSLASRDVKVIGLEARSAQREEYVSYILRSGSQFITKPIDFEAGKITHRSRGQSDGVLLRLSSAGFDHDAAEMHERFLADLLEVLSLEDRKLLLGAASS